MDRAVSFSETVAIGSFEGFIDAETAAKLNAIMDDHLTPTGRDAYGALRTDTIHEVPGLSPDESMNVYEPSGRVEISQIPDEAQDILQSAYADAAPTLARTLPSVTTCRPWVYVEYSIGQHITPHIDGIAPNPMAWPRQVAGISVVTHAEPGGGGEFFVETTSNSQVWQGQADGGGYAPGMWLAHDGADNSADWFRAMQRTRWAVAPAPGTALVYGSQLTHGTQPVRSGRVRKFISWLICEEPAA